MPTYKEFEGINLIADPTQKTIAEVLVKNELGGASDGYQIDHAETSNSGYSFGGNQMDLSKNANGREIFSTIIKTELGDNFFNSIKDRAYSIKNQTALTSQEKSQINSALSSNYGKTQINQAFKDYINNDDFILNVNKVERRLGTNFSDDVKLALIDYDNQFYLNSNDNSASSMKSKLKNTLDQNGIITLKDIEESIRSTKQYKDNRDTQEARIQTTRKIIKDAGLISDGSDSTSSLKNSLAITLATITVTAEKEAVAKSWFETFSGSLDKWTGSTTNFMKETASDVVNFFSSPSESLSKIGGWISSAFTSGESNKTPDPSTINNSLLDLNIRTDKLQGFSSNQDTTQVGNAIGDGDWEVRMPINIINGDGWKNVAMAGLATDFNNPARQTISPFESFARNYSKEISNLERNIINTNSAQNLFNSTQLNVNLSNLTNNAIGARTFLNIDPVVLDLNGDGVKLTSYNNSQVSFDVDNDGKLERTGWVTPQDGILVHDKNQDGKINNITETISEYYNPNDGSIKDADGKYSTDGLSALKKLDSNRDGKFNNQDAKWNSLRVWVDANGDAQTDTGELKTLTEAGVKEINLATITQANKERNEGNIIFSKTTYTTTEGQKETNILPKNFSIIPIIEKSLRSGNREYCGTISNPQGLLIVEKLHGKDFKVSKTYIKYCFAKVKTKTQSSGIYIPANNNGTKLFNL